MKMLDLRLISDTVAETLVPLLADLLPPPEPTTVVKFIHVKADRGLVKAAARLADAVDRYERSKSTREEGPSKLAVMRAARDVRFWSNKLKEPTE